ncbi:hypothetical protein BJ508DRAFT_307988 [Ascobolus immersus RN42]|uniref:Uncharacterized protein n=1 Tax=Ascobolus immersus RN42 TaxID=1160509 RepID=A0A3N4I701_ASCIM|nr:hypothetical protein BJ508DRAFT_307988 [Ascobolus immersus RN42]
MANITNQLSRAHLGLPLLRPRKVIYPNRSLTQSRSFTLSNVEPEARKRFEEENRKKVEEFKKKQAEKEKMGMEDNELILILGSGFIGLKGLGLLRLEGTLKDGSKFSLRGLLKVDEQEYGKVIAVYADVFEVVFKKDGGKKKKGGMPPVVEKFAFFCLKWAGKDMLRQAFTGAGTLSVAIAVVKSGFMELVKAIF